MSPVGGGRDRLPTGSGEGEVGVASDGGRKIPR